MENTITFKLPFSGKDAVLKAWITGAEAKFIQEPLLSGVNVDLEKGEGTMGKMSFGVLTESNHRALVTFVVSIEGMELKDKTKDLLTLHEFDIQAIYDKIGELRKKK